MAAGIYNFTIEQGATFTRTFKYKDSTGASLPISNNASINMQIRETIGSAEPVPNGTFKSGSGFILSTNTEDNVQNQFTLVIPAATSSNFSFTTAVYDIELIESNVTTRLLQGKIKLSKEVTRL
tara:strand:+ start:28 stop:399 length:372 start_codon:yes stop_codon:yes gene_type:complete